jgi:hypothetical protein
MRTSLNRDTQQTVMAEFDIHNALINLFTVAITCDFCLSLKWHKQALISSHALDSQVL